MTGMLLFDRELRSASHTRILARYHFALSAVLRHLLIFPSSLQNSHPYRLSILFALHTEKALPPIYPPTVSSFPFTSFWKDPIFRVTDLTLSSLTFFAICLRLWIAEDPSGVTGPFFLISIAIFGGIFWPLGGGQLRIQHSHLYKSMESKQVKWADLLRMQREDVVDGVSYRG